MKININVDLVTLHARENNLWNTLQLMILKINQPDIELTLNITDKYFPNRQAD